MAWMSMLYQTYENNAAMAGKAVDDKAPLSLVAHMPANAQIEVTLDENGNFAGAAAIDKQYSKTLIPVTEQSAGRASGDAPHALCDTLAYVAGDFGSYQADAKLVKTCNARFEKYLSALSAWASSDFSHPKVKAIYEYVSKKCMTSDLIKAGILESDGNGKLVEKKVSGQPYEKALVRFIVNSASADTGGGTWQDPTLFNKYTEYYSTVQIGKKDRCYLTGDTKTVCVNHPKGIISSNYNSKLISANDKANFTFRGRFITPDEACTVSYEATQKAHSALTWLAARQSNTYALGRQERRTFICWNPQGKEVPSLSFGFVDDSEASSNTEEQFKKNLYLALEGFEKTLDSNDDIVIIGLDAATQGRLSVTYYNELKASDFLCRIKSWHETCCWYFIKFTPAKKPYTAIEPPKTHRIIEYAFGTERGDFIEVSDKIMKEQAQRIMNCILNAQPVPRDIVHALAIRASTPMAYKKRWNYENVLSTACALIAKYDTDKKGVKTSMTLNHEERNRSYLFGRLLAVCEKVERSTYSRDENREPNAIRLQSTFVNHPMHTWMTLETALNPYFQRMRPGSRKFYKDIISDITAKFPEDMTGMNKALDEKYLLGYYLQRAEFNTGKKENENNEEDE